MSGGVQPSMFFLGLPDVRKLCCITLTLQEEDEELRSKQIKTCRELVLLYSDVLASPALDSFSEITVVMAIQMFQRGVLQVFAQRRSLQLGSPQCVFPGVLQCCLSYSLISRLAPSWNKAGLYLVTGKDFLSERRRLSAVSMELSTSEGQLCISMEAHTVRLPPATLEDLDLPPLVLKRFCSDPDSVLDPTSTGGAIWCHVLPSMKKGQIITISRQLPRDGPFRTYRDLQNHWNCLYGYRLPELAEEDVVYCSVYFRLVGEKLFTYPLSCIRLQPVQRCPRADLQGALGPFLSDIRDRLQSVCGFPSRLTSKPCYRTVSLDTAATVNSTASSSSGPVLTQLPPPPRPVKPSFGSQPPAWAPLSQQDGAQGLLGNGRGFVDRLTQSQECRGDWPSSSSSSRVSFTDSSSHQSVSSPSSSSSSSSSHPPLPPPSQTPVNPAPKLVPIFKNKCPSRHINVALLRVQKQREQLSRGGEERGRVTLPAFRRKTTSAGPSSASLPVPPLPTVRQPRAPGSSSAPQLPDRPKLQHISSLSPAAKSRPGFILAPKLATRPKPSQQTNGKPSFPAADLQDKATTQPSAAPPESPPPSDTSVSSRAGPVFKSKLKKSRSATRDVDVENMARSNQLSRLNSASLLAWLKGRGVLVSSKQKKEELMLRVMGCLAEA